MARALAQDQARALARRDDVLAQIGEVDARPQPVRGLDRLLLRELRIFAEIGERVAEGGLAELEETADIPALQIVLVRVEKDREVEIVRYEGNRGAVLRQPRGLKDVKALDDEDVGSVDDRLLSRNDVVDEVRVERRLHIALAGLDVGQEVQELAGVVALRKALALHEAEPLELGVREKEAVGRDEVDLRRVGPAGEERLQDARRGGFPDR